MNDLSRLREAGPAAVPLSPAARSAARASLLAEIEGATPRTAARRTARIGRTAALRTGLALGAAAAAWIGAVALTGHDAAPGTPPPDGIALVAVEAITFPLSPDPAPTAMTPSFIGSTDSQEAVAHYSSADGLEQLSVRITSEPAWSWLDEGVEWHYAFTERGTVEVDGVAAESVRGTTVCDGCPVRPVAALGWERKPGQFVSVHGEGAYGDPVALLALAESLVDRPQPVTLQIGYAPAGWSVTGWHEQRMSSVALRDDAHPERGLTVDCAPENVDGMNWNVGMLTGRSTPYDVPVTFERVGSPTVHGRPAELASRLDLPVGIPPYWTLAWNVDDDVVCQIQAPKDFSPDDVVALAGGVTYTR